MICKKCGHDISDVDKICENCGTSVELEKEEKISAKKGKHIDIEDITEEKEGLSFNETKRSVRNFLLFLLLGVILILMYVLGSFILDNAYEKVFNKYEDILKYSKLGVVYLGTNEEIATLCNDYSLNYEFDFVHIESNKISKSKKEKLRKELNIYNVNSTVIIIQDGVPLTSAIVKDQSTLVTYLQKNKVIPNIISDTTDILSDYKEAISSKEETIIYIPTSLDDNTSLKSKLIKEISNNNNLNYYEINAYLLSYKQLKNIMSQLGFSEIQDDLVLYINNGEILYTLDAKSTNEKYYFQLFSNRGIIDVTSDEHIVSISFNNFKTMIRAKEKNVFFIVDDSCKYCDNVKSILSQISKSENIEIYYLDATKDKEEISNIIVNLGYADGITVTPFVLIVENNKYIDSIIGLSDKELYMNKFMEYGIIK